MSEVTIGQRGLAAFLRHWLEKPGFEKLVMTVIVGNAAVLGLETSTVMMEWIGPLLIGLDTAALIFFVVELAARMTAYGRNFWRGPWNIFDFVIVAISLAPTSGGLAVLRCLRILRVLRLISIVPAMRRVVQALLEAIPGMGSVVALLALVFYIFAVISTTLFAHTFPQWFGSLGASTYSLFQIMTLESWSMGIVRPVMEVYPFAWIVFVPFILLTTFAVLNLFVAIIVNAMQESHEAEDAAAHDERTMILEELRALRAEIAALHAASPTRNPVGGSHSESRVGDA